MLEKPKKPSVLKLVVGVLIGAAFFLFVTYEAWEALNTGEITTRSRRVGPTHHFSRTSEPIAFYGLILMWMLLGTGFLGAGVWELRKRLKRRD